MKKVLLWVTAFTLGLASCQKSEVVDDVNAGSNELNFGVYQGKATRAGELTNKALHTNGVSFPLYAYKGKQDAAKTFYFKETLTYVETAAPNPVGKWETSIPRFLPEGKNEYLQFYAFYPTDGIQDDGYKYANYADAASTFPTLDYTIQTDQVDLVAASVNDNIGTSITIPFRHILSQINFGVKGYYGAKITISDIKVNQVFNKGTFSFNPDPNAWGWTNTGALVDYSYTFAENHTTPNSFTTPGGSYTGGILTDPNTEKEIRYIFGDGGKWGPGKVNTWYVTDDGVAIDGSKITDTTDKLANSLMLMPQGLEPGVLKAFVTFKYTITDLEGGVIIGGTTPAKGQFDLNMGNTTNAYADTWKPNLRYVYIIDFTGYLDGQKLTFDVDVETNPWENYNPDDGNDGIVLLSSLDGTIFRETISKLSKTGTSVIPLGHLFSNISWNWSPYSMTNSFAISDVFKVDFKNVKFNGNTLTIIPPFGFTVNDGTTNDATTIGVTKPETVLTFKATAAYYGNVTDLNDAIAGDTNQAFNVSTSILLSAVNISTLTTTGKTITLKFASAYGKAVPKNWKLSDSGKTATYTKPAPIVP